MDYEVCILNFLLDSFISWWNIFITSYKFTEGKPAYQCSRHIFSQTVNYLAHPAGNNNGIKQNLLSYKLRKIVEAVKVWSEKRAANALEIRNGLYSPSSKVDISSWWIEDCFSMKFMHFFLFLTHPEVTGSERSSREDTIF